MRRRIRALRRAEPRRWVAESVSGEWRATGLFMQVLYITRYRVTGMIYEASHLILSAPRTRASMNVLRLLQCAERHRDGLLTVDLLFIIQNLLTTTFIVEYKCTAA